MVAKLKCAGIDWLTITTDKKEVAERWYGQVQSSLFRGEKKRADVRERQIQGYVGLQGDGLFIGDRPDGWMLIETSDYAREHAHAAIRAGGRASRIDLQVTLEMPGGVDEAIRKTWQEVVLHKTTTGRQVRKRAEIDQTRMLQVRVGSRASELYGRCYNKEEESKEERYKCCVRWETEYKGQAAQAIGAALSIYSVIHLKTVDTLIDWWKKHGVTVPYECGEIEPIEIPSKRKTSLESKRAWLASQVSPTVGIIAQEFGIMPTMLDVLGRAFDEEMLGVIMRAVAENLGY